MNYIAVDAHSTTLECHAVNGRGKMLRRDCVPTSAEHFITFVRRVPKPRTVFIEEGNLAAWLLETALRSGENLVITDPKRNHWIAKAEDKQDSVDAEKLAQLARGGYTKAIPHPVGERRRFRELVVCYHDTVHTQTRIKNKIKAKFRANGIPCRGETVYSPEHRSAWLKKLPPHRIVHTMLLTFWSQLDHVAAELEKLKRRVVSESRKFPEVKLLKKIPGIGPIHSATLAALVVTPHRFATKKKLWKYAGHAIIKKSSGTTTYAHKLTKEYNRLLKCTIKQAVESAIKAKNNPFGEHYLRLVFAGVHPRRAKLIVGRKLLSTIYAIWKKGEFYRPSRRLNN